MIPVRLVIETNLVVSAALKPEGLQRQSSADHRQTCPIFARTDAFPNSG
jgi:hypothetical protein